MITDTDIFDWQIENIKGNSCLIIDDSEWERKFIKEVLVKTGMFTNFIEARDGAEGFRILIEKKDYIDLVFCDIVMAPIDGINFLRMRLARHEVLLIPVIMLTSETEINKKVMGLELGAQDWIIKPYEETKETFSKELIARARAHLRIKILQERLRKANNFLTELVKIDTLTKLYNRRYLFESLESEFSRAKRHGRVISFLIIDIDNFKVINDTYGHQVGDCVLSEFSEFLRTQIRKHDIAGRYGGEEFGIILPETRTQGAFMVADRMRKELENKQIEVQGHKIRLTVSGGISQYPSPNINSMDEMVRYADFSLLEAKKAGKNRIIIWGQTR